MTVGSYKSADGSIDVKWEMPEYTTAERLACTLGVHIASRKPVVKGWITYFAQIERWWCACGQFCWIKSGRYFVDKHDEKEANGHIRWIQHQEDMHAQDQLREVPEVRAR